MRGLRAIVSGLNVVALLHAAGVLASAQQTPIPGKYYEYYIVAKTGSTYTDLGSGGGPSINDAREVAFRGSTANGNALWFAAGATPPVNFNPGESFSSSDAIQPSVQLNTNHQVVSEDRITTTSPATTSIRLYNAKATDSFIYAARGGPLATGVGGYLYDAVFANPSVNKNGDVVFTAFYSALAPAKVLGYLAAGTTTPVEQFIRSGNPKPMIADNGNVVVQVGGSGGQSNYQILVYPTGLGSPDVIADTATNWTSLDNDPGISRDGRVIAFQGNPNALGASAIGTTVGPGIFIAVDEGTGFANAKIIRVTGGKVEDVAADRAANKGNFDGVCDPGEICKAAAELGFDDTSNPITISSYATDSRVGVANVDFGAAGIDDDSMVISFVGTPSSASRDNSQLQGTPLLFSAQQGLWTIRVDVQHQLVGAQARVYHPFTPIPVVQIGDHIGPDTVTGIGVYDPIANAAYDETGSVRTMRRGDHRVAFWASTAAGQIIVRGNHLDSDQDGLLDHWETSGIDMNQDGTVDLKLSTYGADPFKRDLFLQVDWVGMPGSDEFKPAGGVFPSDVTGTYSIFEANLRGAEALSGAMYGATIDGSAPADIPAGVTPHVDAGTAIDSLDLPMSLNLGAGAAHGGNYVGMPGSPGTLPMVVYFGEPGMTVPGVEVRAFQNVKDTYLGTADKNARVMAFHYLVFAPFQDFLPNYPNTPYSASITAGTSGALEVNGPPSAFPGVKHGSFLILTSGADASMVRQIDTVSTNGTTGNAIYTLSAPFAPGIALGDSMAFLEPSTGLSEVAFAPTPDNNSLPGNDLIVSAGAFGVLQGVPPNQCLEAETASHELGHTLGLRHGGTDHKSDKAGNVYESVMSYTWQLVCTPTPQVPNYSKAGDPTFDDYAHMQFNFADVQFHLSTSLGQARGEGYPSDLQQQEPEQTLSDAIAKNGPLDSVPPAVAITSPVAGAGVALGSNLVVNVTATDNVQVVRVSVAFDTNGNGVVDAGEAVNATKTGTNTYQAVFANVSGVTGLRSLSAIAWDEWSNSTRTAISVAVGGPVQVSVPNVVGLTQAAATSSITNAGLVVGTVTKQASGTVAAGSVISESPAAGVSVNSGSAVNLVVSTGPAQVSVPNVVGLTQAAATSSITGAGLVVGAVTKQSSSTVAAGNVISESPVAGTSVNSGSAVNLVVSTGPAQVAVPNVVGLTQAGATSSITGAGLVVGTVTKQTSSTVAAGNVISESPVAGTSVNSGSAVSLVVSTGPAQVLVPNVVGLTQAAATSSITSAGLVVGTVTKQSSSTVASGNVINESPVAGTSVNSGSAVNLFVSTGPAQVLVPNVVGLTQAAATSSITNAGLVVGTVTKQSSSTVSAGNVISESPVAGTSVNSGSAVNLVVSTGPAQVLVPNVVGLTQAAATSSITGAGLVVGTVTKQTSSTVASGSVISESPVAGTSVNSGSAVNLVVSTGPAQVLVPNVVGLTQASATSSITGAGLLVGTVTKQTSSTVASGSVISESPVAGTSVNSGSAVNLVVSTGPAQVLVPNVVGLTQASATSSITGAGLVVGTVTKQTSSTVASGSVISESPVAGTSVNSGSAVNLVVSTGPAQVPTVVSFNVLFGSESYNVLSGSRNRLPWAISGISVVFSEPITTGNAASLSGFTVSGFSGLGTTTLTWTVATVAQGSLSATLAGSGTNALKDANGNALYSGAGFTKAVKVLWGDFNDDGLVNASDLSGVNNATATAYNIFADMNGDGVVNVADVGVVRTRIGTSLP